MPTQKLTAFEQTVLAGLAEKAGLAAAVLEAWAELPAGSAQSARSLIDAAQLGMTEEGATQGLLERSASLGLIELTPAGYKLRNGAHERFPRLPIRFRCHLDVAQGAGRAGFQLLDSAQGWRTGDFPCESCAVRPRHRIPWIVECHRSLFGTLDGDGRCPAGACRYRCS